MNNWLTLKMELLTEIDQLQKAFHAQTEPNAKRIIAFELEGLEKALGMMKRIEKG